jgi:hypothetical protein
MICTLRNRRHVVEAMCQFLEGREVEMIFENVTLMDAVAYFLGCFTISHFRFMYVS